MKCVVQFLRRETACINDCAKLHKHTQPQARCVLQSQPSEAARKAGNCLEHSQRVIYEINNEALAATLRNSPACLCFQLV
jgi:hypothetical protein